MCGINGIVEINGRQTFDDQVGRMNQALAHRGPDSEGIFSKTGTCLGHRRLSIIDRTSSANQPFSARSNRYQMVYNGEIYNFRELQNLLPDVTWRTQSDTEVLCEGFAAQQESWLSKLNGMFAFAIWDDQKNCLYIARDRMGIKPLYYSLQGTRLVFSSEMRALLASGIVERRLNKNKIAEYLGMQTVFAPETLIEGVKMLPPGHILKFNSEGISINPFWNLNDFAHHTTQATLPEVHKEVGRLFKASVQRRMIADVPFGAFLSGGIDSSAIVGAMAETSSIPVNTFSVVFTDASLSERKYAKVIADKWGTHHHEIELSENEILSKVGSALLAMDHPSGDGPNSYIVSEATKKAGITMALSGLGGDELFGGYPVFSRIRKYPFWVERFLALSGSNINGLAGQLAYKLSPSIGTRKIKAFLEGGIYDRSRLYDLTRQVFMDDEVAALLSFNSGPMFTSQWPDFDESHQVSAISSLEATGYMQNVLLRDTDQMSMAHALEVRVPFLDHTLVEFILSLPDEYKTGNFPKKLLVDSLPLYLPDEIVHRPKMGFTLPWGSWLRNELRNLVEDQLNFIASTEYFNPDEVKKLWRDFLIGAPGINWSRIWLLCVLGHWMRENNVR